VKWIHDIQFNVTQDERFPQLPGSAKRNSGDLARRIEKCTLCRANAV